MAITYESSVKSDDRLTTFRQKGLGLAKVIDVDQDKCVNCHACIGACPVKFCNDGSGEFVEINQDMCIGCGNCIDACSHGARKIIDDLDIFLSDLARGVSIVSIVAPAVAANFPRQYLGLNGWLKSIGVKANFDVSFGAELTVKTYLDHIQRNKPATVIAQPCPAIVTYIETYRPELLQHLAPADSPMLHTIKMVKRFYPQYSNSHFVIISPCAAKRREFDETGLGDYNVTMKALTEYFQKNSICLSQFAETEYDNADAERAVLFSTPGGLRDTLERWSRGAAKATRKVEGVPGVYHYLDHLTESVSQHKAPLLVDCLNCEMGCNGGTATTARGKGIDLIEGLISDRAEQMKKRYVPTEAEDGELQEKVIKNIDEYWEPGLYGRHYVDRSANNQIKKPSDIELEHIYKLMKKDQKEDFRNCSACGYGSCEQMAVAIFNDLNRPENCHTYQEALIREGAVAKQEMLQHVMQDFTQVIEGVVTVSKDADDLDDMAKSIIKLSSQAQILALNAAIESSRAGAAGAAFGVVADAVKEMSDNVREQAVRIQPCSHKLHDAFQMVVREVENLSERVAEIIGDHNQSSLAA
jgi:iron only hydrogenase large subunit-like protein